MFRLSLSIAFAVAAGAFLAGTASAHVPVTSGDFEFEIGWGEEPAVAGIFNTILVSIAFHPDENTTVMLNDVQDDLTVTVTTGPVSAVKRVEPIEGQDGWYAFPIVPTREGVYTVRVEGSINGTAFNVSATPESVDPASDIEFPVADPSAKELADNATAQQMELAWLRAQVTSLGSGSGANATDLAQLKSENEAIRGQASTAYALGAFGAVLGGVGVLLAALSRRRRPDKQ